MFQLINLKSIEIVYFIYNERELKGNRKVMDACVDVTFNVGVLVLPHLNVDVCSHCLGYVISDWPQTDPYLTGLIECGLKAVSCPQQINHGM